MQFPAICIQILQVKFCLFAVIRPQSSAAEGVSIMDMNKRAALNSTKKQMLKNLSIFASPTRLCVHNLPVKLTDKALRRLFKKFSSAEARITEVLALIKNDDDIF